MFIIANTVPKCKHPDALSCRTNGNYLSPYSFVMGDMDTWERWEYTTVDGAGVVPAMPEDDLPIFCQRPDG